MKSVYTRLSWAKELEYHKSSRKTEVILGQEAGTAFNLISVSLIEYCLELRGNTQDITVWKSSP